MGARPLFALNLVGFPRDTLPMSVLGEILRGGADKAAEAGIAIVGGHSIDDAEPKYGLAVVGIAHPERVLRKAGLAPGDRLFLTKPLGIGIISTAIKRDVAKEADVREAVRVMTTLNRAAAEAAVATGVRAATDVTGFGLLGHLSEMTSASGVSATVWLDRVPVLDAAWQLARDGVVPGGTRRNLAFVEQSVKFDDDITPTERLVLADAQTSGGLLLGVSPASAEALRMALEAAGALSVAEIGEVTTGNGTVSVRRSAVTVESDSFM
jgi:selenide,water dikinase